MSSRRFGENGSVPPDRNEPLTVTALSGIGEVHPGDDLAALVTPLLAGLPRPPSERCVLVVAQKIVSKAEGRLVYLDEVVATPRAHDIAAVTGKHPALVEMVLRESSEVLRFKRNVLIVRHRLGFVVANAGIDQSNVGPGGARAVCLLLPEAPDASAQRLRDAIRARLGWAPAVIISDSFGRAWRRGVVNVALGSAGLAALIDCRGRFDRHGRELQVTEVAIGDAVAAAAGLVMGESNESNPVILVDGGNWSGPEIAASALVRPVTEDLFT